jgi:FKBP-type peptidyl-prolyl cis-trans isomerase FkpA
MKRWMCALALAAGMLLSSCGEKECTPASPASEEGAIQAYNAAQGYTATKDPSGLYYQIVDPGTGVYPTANSRVTVNYTGKLFNGNTFDSNTNPGLITGWQIGIPKIRVGGTIRLMVPSAYAYGCEGSAPAIPSNTPLFFEIKLLAVN